MLNKLTKLLCFGIILTCFLLGYNSYHYWEIRNLNGAFIQEFVNQNRERQLKLDKCQLELDECKKYNVFRRAVLEIGYRPYSNNYDCYGHSKDLQSALRELDIESSILINSGRNHAWLGVWIETTEGKFINPNHNLHILEVR